MRNGLKANGKSFHIPVFLLLPFLLFFPALLIVSGTNIPEATAGGTVYGTVTGTDGNGVGGVLVEVITFKDQRVGSGYTLDSPDENKGKYRIENIPPGTYQVKFTPDCNNDNGYLPEYYNEKDYWNSGDPVVVDEGGQTEVNDQLETGFAISGTVTFSSDPPPAPLPVVFVSVSGSNGAGYNACSTDQTGLYTVYVPTGDWKIEFRPQNEGCWGPEWYDDQKTFFEAQVVSVSGQDVSNINAQLVAGGFISGRVSDALGNGIAQVDVGVADADSTISGTVVRTDENGDYSFRIPLGSWKVYFSPWIPNGYLLGEYYNNAPSGTTAAIIEVNTPCQWVSGVDATLEEGGAVAGRLVDSQGRGIPGACVNIEDVQHEILASVQTDVNGYFRAITPIGEGYRLVINKCEATDEFWNFYPETYTYPYPITVVQGQDTNIPDVQEDIILPTWGAVSGTVTIDGGQPGAGACVFVGSETQLYNTQAGTDGRYRILLPEGIYTVRADPCVLGGFYFSKWYENALDKPQATQVVVTPKNETTGIDITLEQGGAIEGKVTSDGINGLAGIDVAACNATGFCHYWGNTGPGGTYRLVVPSGTWKVSFNIYPYGIYYLPQWYSNKSSWINSDDVQVIAEQTIADINALLPLGGIISGNVYDANNPNVPITNVAVAAWDLNSNLVVETVTGWHAPGGGYMITVPAGWYNVNTYHRGPSNDYYIYSVKFPGNPVQVTTGQPNEYINFGLTKGGKISGRVYSADDPAIPIPDACIQIEDSNGNPVEYANSGADGSYTANAVQAGVTYRVRVDRCSATGNYNFSVYFAEPVPVSLEQTTENIDFGLTRSGAISGKVINTRGAPIPNISIGATDLNCNYLTGTRTVADGTFSVSLPVGSYKLNFWPWDPDQYYLPMDWYNNCSSAPVVQVTSIETPTVIPDVVLSDGGKIAGKVTGPSGAGLANINVNIYNQNNIQVSGTRTNQYGNYNFPIANGTYKIQFNPVLAGNYVLEWFDNKPNSSEASPIAILNGQTTANISAQLATPEILTISGCVRDANTNSGIPDVVMNGLPGNPRTGSNGCYSTNISYGWGSWSGRVTPFHVGYTFNPAYRDYVSINSNQPNQNYIGDPVLFNLYEDFSGQEIDPGKWDMWALLEQPSGSLFKPSPILTGTWDFVREIRSNELFSKTAGFGRTTQNRLEFKNPNSINYLKADLRVDQIEGNYDTVINTRGTLPSAGLVGTFYNDGTGTGVPGSYVGDVSAQVKISKWRNGEITANWEVIKFTSTDGNKFDVLASGSLSSLMNLGVNNQLTLDRDPVSGMFTFGFNGIWDIWQGPVNPIAPNVPSKALRTYVGVIDTAQGGFVSDPNLGGKITAAFDNVEAKVSALGSVIIVDDFSSSPLDVNKWATQELVRELVGGKLLSKSRNANQNDRINNNLNFKYPDQVNEFQAKVTLHEHSINKGSMNARLGGTFYNDTGDPLSGYRRDVWAHVSLNVNPGQSPFANWVVLRFDDPNAAQGVWAVLGSGTFPIPINLGRAYNLYIKWDGNHFTFKCDDYVAYFSPTTAIHPPSMKMKRLDTSINPPSPYSNFEGYISASFDDVVVGPPVSWTINASAGANGNISPSGAITVNNGANRTFTIIPSSGYMVTDVLVDGISQGPISSYTFTTITANHTISVTFGNTPAGGGTVVIPIDTTTSDTPVTLSFDTVTITGTTTLETSPVASVPPTGFELPGTYFDISTDAVYEGPIEVCISYDDAVVGDDTNLKLLHYEGDHWVDRTSSLDTANNIICAMVNSLSPFTLLKIPPSSIPLIKATQSAVSPNPVPVNSPVALTAILDGRYGNESNIASPVVAVEYSLDGGQNWINLAGTFNSTVVNVNQEIPEFPIPGVYEVCVRGVRIQEEDEFPGEKGCVLVAAYDPNGGYVTGGGWITSPADAFAENPALTGKATFGFVSKYQKGALVPTGQTEFQFKVANLNFHSEIYEWLVVAGAKAQYKGTGTINGSGNYGFMLTAIDGQIQGGGGVDRFRIKIWDKGTNAIIYDNQNGAADSAYPVTALGGGNIVIHKEK